MNIIFLINTSDRKQFVYKYTIIYEILIKIKSNIMADILTSNTGLKVEIKIKEKFNDGDFIIYKCSELDKFFDNLPENFAF